MMTKQGHSMELHDLRISTISDKRESVSKFMGIDNKTKIKYLEKIIDQLKKRLGDDKMMMRYKMENFKVCTMQSILRNANV